jgi:hypothetical protein
VIENQALVLVELYKVEVKVLKAIFFEQVLVTQHVTQIKGFLPKRVLQGLGVSIEDSSRSRT